jgi:hypothetical protein
MATVALVNPQLVSSGWGRGDRPETMDDALPRHSLTFLSAALKAEGHKVTLVDLRLLSGWEHYQALLANCGADFVCVTAHTSESDVALECLARAKRVLPACRTVVGGIHFTMYPEVARAFGLADYVVRGEGEVSLPKLLKAQQDFEPVFWGEVPDLDQLPFEDRELYSDYAQRLQFPLWDLPLPIVDILTKRGCPWQCRFCCGPGEQNLFTRPSPVPDHRYPTFRHRSVANVIAEMEQLYEKYRFRGVVFHDDQFIIRRDWVEGFCHTLHAAGFVSRGVRWWAAVRADVICRHPELIARMREAGQQVMSIGFESFSDRMLRWMRKDTSYEVNMRAAEICHRNGLDIFANVIFGMPYEDGRWYLEDDVVSLQAIKQIRPRHFSPSYFSPIPGSWFHQWAVQEGLIINDAPQYSGRRNPSEAKLRGVDYDAIESLLAEYRSLHGPDSPPRKPLRLRLQQFMRQPFRTQVEIVRSKLFV